LPPKTWESDRGVSELHDNAPKRVPMQSAAIAETEIDWSFHLEP
jgi:hypothetical protein